MNVHIEVFVSVLLYKGSSLLQIRSYFFVYLFSLVLRQSPHVAYTASDFLSSCLLSTRLVSMHHHAQ